MITAEIVNDIGLAIFTHTGMCETSEQALILGSLATRLRPDLPENVAIFEFFQMVAHRDLDRAVKVFHLNRKRLKGTFENSKAHEWDVLKVVFEAAGEIIG